MLNWSARQVPVQTSFCWIELRIRRELVKPYWWWSFPWKFCQIVARTYPQLASPERINFQGLNHEMAHHGLRCIQPKFFGRCQPRGRTEAAWSKNVSESTYWRGWSCWRTAKTKPCQRVKRVMRDNIGSNRHRITSKTKKIIQTTRWSSSTHRGSVSSVSTCCWCIHIKRQ